MVRAAASLAHREVLHTFHRPWHRAGRMQRDASAIHQGSHHTGVCRCDVHFSTPYWHVTLVAKAYPSVPREALRILWLRRLSWLQIQVFFHLISEELSSLHYYKVVMSMMPWAGWAQYCITVSPLPKGLCCLLSASHWIWETKNIERIKLYTKFYYNHGKL